jgi:hypothetical protein
VEVNPKGKGEGKGKGKSKVKDEPTSDESDFEQDNVKLGKNGKKPVLAKAAYWKDIPKWEKGTGSLLMNLPGDVMDHIFGLREELGVSAFKSSFLLHSLNVARLYAEGQKKYWGEWAADFGLTF